MSLAAASGRSWRWENRGERGWWRVNDALGIEDGPHRKRHERHELRGEALDAACDRLAKAEQLARASRDLYERVEMDEAIGICLSDRVPSLRLGKLLREWYSA